MWFDCKFTYIPCGWMIRLMGSSYFPYDDWTISKAELLIWFLLSWYFGGSNGVLEKISVRSFQCVTALFVYTDQPHGCGQRVVCVWHGRIRGLLDWQWDLQPVRRIHSADRHFRRYAHTSILFFWYMYSGYMEKIRARARMNLDNIMLSERRQTHKSTHCIRSFIWNAQKRQTHLDQKSMSGW